MKRILDVVFVIRITFALKKNYMLQNLRETDYPKIKKLERANILKLTMDYWSTTANKVDSGIFFM